MQPTHMPDPRGAVQALARELRHHHSATAEHSHRLAGLARRVADRMGLDALDATEVELVAVLHDVGKLMVEPEVLDWPGPLSARQRRLIHRHTIAGEEVLARTAGLEHLAEVVRATHEAWDGSGYPDGIGGEEIPLAARIVAVVDAFDAMVTDRAYRPARPVSEACVVLRDGAGRQWDPDVVATLLSLVE